MSIGWYTLWLIHSQTIAGTDTIDCDIDADKCDVGKALSGAKYLRGLSGQPIARAGKCNRVSCSWGAGIYVCSNASIARDYYSDNSTNGSTG